MLAKNQAKLAIYFLDNENADSESDSEEGGQGTTLKVNVIDQEDIHRNAAVEVLVENLKATTIEQMKLKVCVFFNSFSARIFTDFGLIRRQSDTQGSMGRDPPRYPPRDPEL